MTTKTWYPVRVYFPAWHGLPADVHEDAILAASPADALEKAEKNWGDYGSPEIELL